jgi:plasmid rolling circle replication initiator protein Rep
VSKSKNQIYNSTPKKGVIFLLKIDYTEKKVRNQAVLLHIEKHISESAYNNFCSCGNWLQMKADKEIETVKLNRANFCKNRFCPMCSWRKTLKEAVRLSVIMDYIETEHEKTFIMVTFTAPNVRGEILPAEVTKYNKAFKKVVERKEIKAINKGYVRKLEITYNKKRGDYHPHFHVIFAVNKSYFTDRTYLNQNKWLNLWREVMQDDSITQVHVQRLKKSEVEKIENEMKRSSAVNEVAKYAAKDADYCYSQEVFDNFYAALKGRQILTYNGLFTSANKKYKNGELDEYKEIDKTEYYWILDYNWTGQAYSEKNRRLITIEDVYSED